MGCLSLVYRTMIDVIRGVIIRPQSSSQQLLVSSFELIAECPCSFHTFNSLQTLGSSGIPLDKCSTGGLRNLLQLWGKRQEKGEERFLPLTPMVWRLWGSLGVGAVGNSCFEISSYYPGAEMSLRTHLAGACLQSRLNCRSVSDFSPRALDFLARGSALTCIPEHFGVEARISQPYRYVYYHLLQGLMPCSTGNLRYRQHSKTSGPQPTTLNLTLLSQALSSFKEKVIW